MKLLVLLIALGYVAAQDDKPVCGEDNWQCMTQDLTELNTMLGKALEEVPEEGMTIRFPDQPKKPKGFKMSRMALQFIMTIKDIVAEVGGDEIVAMWQEVDEMITGGIVEIKDMNFDFSVNLDAALKIIGPMDLFKGTISTSVENFNAYVEVAYEDEKFVNKVCDTTPDAVTIFFDNEAKMNRLIKSMVSRMNDRLFKMGPFGKVGIPSGLTDIVLGVLQSETPEFQIDLHLCDIIDSVFTLLNSVDGVGGWLQKLRDQ